MDIEEHYEAWLKAMAKDRHKFTDEQHDKSTFFAGVLVGIHATLQGVAAGDQDAVSQAASLAAKHTKGPLEPT